MARFETFDRDIKVATADLDPAAISSALAQFAKQDVQRAIAAGEASERFDRYVNGRKGAAEETVRAPGPIVYEFIHWPRIVQMALAELVKRSPKRSGRYADSFFVLADSKPVTDFAAIPIDAEVVIANAQPYTRKIEVGAMKMSVPPRHFDQAKSAMARAFGRDAGFNFETRFLNIPAGIHALVPYVLKGGSGRRGRTDKDRRAGSKLTYPALVMNVVT